MKEKEETVSETEKETDSLANLKEIVLTHQTKIHKLEQREFYLTQVISDMVSILKQRNTHFERFTVRRGE